MIFTEGQPLHLSVFERYPRLEEIPKEGFPNYIAIIPDGNRRDAKSQGLEPIEGHFMGTKVMLTLLRDLRELPINYVTMWGFSADNWKRSEKEVKGLMELFEKTIKINLAELMQNNVRLIHLGRKDRLPQSLEHALTNAEGLTEQNSRQTVSLAIDFGGEDQELRIAKRLKQEVLLNPTIPITREYLESLRDGGGRIPPADFLIRTSRERRTSDIGWLNGRQTELYFIEKLFPQVTTGDVVEALVDFSKRQRRMGA